MLPLLLAIGGSALGNVIGNMIGANAASKASKAQLQAANKAQGQITSAYNSAKGYQQPYYDIGTQNARSLSQMVNGGQFDVNPYSYQMQQAPQMDFNFEADPSYQWRMQQGMNAINGGAAARGNQLSGATMKALQKYGQGMASQEYANAFDRYNTNRNFANNQYQFGTQQGMANALNTYNANNQQATQRYNRFNDLAGMGQTAAGNMGNLASNYGANMSGLYGDMGNAQAAGIMGQGQAYGNLASNIGNAANLAGMFYGGNQSGAIPNAADMGYNPSTGMRESYGAARGY